jgi:hypothetical protein
MTKAVVLDFTGVTTFQNMSVGRHKCKVTKCEIAIAKNSSNKKLVIKFENVDGESIDYNLGMTENTKWKLKLFLESLGEKGLEGKYKLDTESLVGKYCTVEVTEEEYEGKMYVKVKNTFKLTSTVIEQVEEIENEEDFEDLI